MELSSHATRETERGKLRHAALGGEIITMEAIIINSGGDLPSREKGKD
jgi:hypothetical protein